MRVPPRVRSRTSPARLALWAGLVLGTALPGCATCEPQIERALQARTPTAEPAPAAEGYVVGCPDVLELTIADRPELSGRRPVAADGRIDAGVAGRIRCEGRTLVQITDSLAIAYRLPPSSVRVRVAEFKSQQLYLAGQVAGLQRAVAYQGPETVSDLLRRAGGITSGAAPDEVYIIRAHVRDGGQPEVFRVHLRDILVKKDTRTNITLQPGDQVFVGETRQFSLLRCLPPWVRPFCESLWGMKPAEEIDKVTR